MKLKLIGGLLLALWSSIGLSQAIVVLPQQLVVDSGGIPRSGAKLQTYACGTTTPLTTYTTAALNVAHANPILSIASGLFPAVYVNSSTSCIKLVLTDSADVAIWTEDNYSPIGSAAQILGVLAPSDGAGSGLDADNVDGVGPFASSTWTPTLVNTTNVDASVLSTAWYIRVGSFVYFALQLSIDPTATAATLVEFTLPVASNFSSAAHMTGVVHSSSGSVSGFLNGNTTDDRGQINFTAGATANSTAWAVGSYRIL